MPERRAKELLDRWRELERLVDSVAPEERLALVTEIQRVKREYAEIVDQLRGQAPALEGGDLTESTAS